MSPRTHSSEIGFWCGYFAYIMNLYAPGTLTVQKQKRSFSNLDYNSSENWICGLENAKFRHVAYKSGNPLPKVTLKYYSISSAFSVSMKGFNDTQNEWTVEQRLTRNARIDDMNDAISI